MRGAAGETRRNEEQGVPLAEHLKCAPQDVTDVCANCFNPSHLLAPRNGPPAISLQIKINLASLTYCIYYRVHTTIASV